MNVTKLGGQVAKKSAISPNNTLNYKYVDDEKLIEDKKIKRRNNLPKYLLLWNF